MRPLLLLLAFVVSLGAGFSLDPRPTQAVGVRGILLCGGKPAPGVLVKLYDSEIFLDKKLAEGKTDSNGRFELTGHKKELSRIDPKLNVYHHCDNKGFLILPRCARKFTIKIPSQYITRGSKTPTRIFGSGVFQLEAKFGGESHDCIHRV